MVNPFSFQLFTESVYCGLTPVAAVSSCNKLLVAGGQKVVSHNDFDKREKVVEISYRDNISKPGG